MKGVSQESKAAAHRAVMDARRRGELEERPCEKCGSLDVIDRHHEDYDNPLDVRFLCCSCHRKYHHYLKRSGLGLGVLDAWIAGTLPEAPLAPKKKSQRSGVLVSCIISHERYAHLVEISTKRGYSTGTALRAALYKELNQYQPTGR